MIQGTTPTITLTGPEGLELPQASNVFVTFQRLAKKITKTGSDLSVDGNVIECRLTQAESLLLFEGPAEVQVNWLYEDGGQQRGAGKAAAFNIDKQLLKEVIGNA